MIESLLGSLLGGVFRLVPEGLKWLDRKDERKHELAMFDKQNEADRMRAQSNIDQINAQGAANIGVAEVNAIIEATKAQSTMTGIKFVDGLNQLVRPMLAVQWLLVLWPAVIICGLILSIQSGTDVLVAMKAAFGPDEKTMASSIASFWLVDRSLRYKGIK
jgi:hypothetical protein